jgi:flagellar biosynthesis/type III secretory pathway ATPase
MDAELDRSLRAMPALRSFLEQGTEESATFAQIVTRFEELAL